MTDTTTAANPKERRHRRTVVEELSPEAWLLRITAERHELIADKDFRFIASLMPGPVMQQCAERYLPLIWNKVLHTGRVPASHGRPVTADAELATFIELLWARFRKMTGQQARDDAHALVGVFSTVKPQQVVEDAMTREQFAERFMARRKGGK